jgi:hypothetical protein
MVPCSVTPVYRRLRDEVLASQEQIEQAVNVMLSVRTEESLDIFSVFRAAIGGAISEQMHRVAQSYPLLSTMIDRRANEIFPQVSGEDDFEPGYHQ